MTFTSELFKERTGLSLRELLELRSLRAMEHLWRSYNQKKITNTEYMALIAWYTSNKHTKSQINEVLETFGGRVV